MQIQDLKNASFFVIKQLSSQLEIAKVMRPTVKGNAYLSEKEIKFKDLDKAKIEMQILEKLRGISTPRITKTLIGEVLVWDIYAIRLKSK